MGIAIAIGTIIGVIALFGWFYQEYQDAKDDWEDQLNDL
jgi:predicted negative regulator of RcsB-dependent stress response